MNHFARIPIKVRAVAPRLIVATIACWAVALLCAVRSEAQIRTPLGVYAHVDVPAYIKSKGVQTGPCSALSPTDASSVHGDLKTLYAGLLQKSASTSPPSDPVSGIELGVPWCLIQPCKPGDSTCTPCESGSSQCNQAKGEDWQWISDVFEAIGSLKNKTVQLNVNPGFDTPQWLLNDINNNTTMGSCDGYFNGTDKHGKDNPSANCGTVTFTNFPECSHVAGQVLPLPWNSMYTSGWQAFLGDLRDWLQTVTNAQALVSISVAGPSGASPELILPTKDNKSYVYWNNGVATLGCSTAAARGSGYHDADAMWATLIRHAQIPDGPNSNPSMYPMKMFPPQVFVDYWNNAIDLYEGIFSGITLVLTPDSGSDFPEIGSSSLFPITRSIAGVDNKTANALWSADCGTANLGSTDYTISCGAKVEILAHFITAQTYVANASNNARSTYVGGMTSSTCTNTGFIDLPGVKVLTSWSFLSSLPPQSFVGGAQFDHAVSQNPTDTSQEGCPGTTCSPDQAAYNVLTDFFNATEGNQYFQGSLTTPNGCTGPALIQPAPIQYVNIDYNDIRYAKGEICPIPTEPAISGTCTTMLDLLNHTQYWLSKIAGGGGTAPAPSCPYAAPPCAPSCQVLSTEACEGCSVTCGLSQKAVCSGGGVKCESDTQKIACVCRSTPSCHCE